MRIPITVRIREMVITDGISLSIQEADTLMEHAVYLSMVRARIGQPIRVSRRSGHRPASYERSKGRSGDSEHSTYHIAGRGAVDLVYTERLLQELCNDSFYTRVCYYPNNGFIHADRKPGPRAYYEAASPTAAWDFKRLLG